MKRQFVSYPKSGRTWIRYMLSRLDADSAIQFHHDRFEFNDGTCPPHDFDIGRRLDAYSPTDRVVYLERDPRDVMVSLYHQVTGRFRDFFGYQGTMSEFLRHPYFGADNLRRFRAMWNEIVRERGFLKVTYEDCHADAAGTLRTITSYYGLHIDPGRIEAAVAAGTFDEMRKVEREESFSEPWLRPRNGMNKVRRGKVGGFREELSPADIEYLDEVFFAPAPRAGT